MLVLERDDGRPNRLEPGVMPVEGLDPKEEWDELEQLYAQALEVLAGLDRLRLFQAGAHLAMAIEAMRQRHPNLSSPD